MHFNYDFSLNKRHHFYTRLRNNTIMILSFQTDKVKHTEQTELIAEQSDQGLQCLLGLNSPKTVENYSKSHLH